MRTVLGYLGTLTGFGFRAKGSAPSYMGVPQIGVVFVGNPRAKDYSRLGFILGPHIFEITI